MKPRGVPQDTDYIVSLSALEPRREPFADTADDDLYWFDPGRNQRLNLLLHLAPYSELILVIGEPGGGKTSLLRQFALRAASRWTIARVVADATMSVGMLVRRICDEAGVALNEAGEDPLTLLSEHVRMLGLGDKALILIVDDADELSGEAFGIIERLLEVSDSCGRPLSVILSGTSRTREQIDRPERKSLAKRCSHVIDVPALTEDETAEYIRHRLTVCGYDPASLSPSVIKKIHKAADGVPARINSLAAAELARHPGTPREHAAGEHRRVRRTFRPMHALALAVVAAAIFFLWPDRVAEPPAPDADQAPAARSDVTDGDAADAGLAMSEQASLPAPPLLDDAAGTADRDAPLFASPEEDAEIMDVPAVDDGRADDTTAMPVEPATPLAPDTTAPGAPEVSGPSVTEPEATPPVIGQPSSPAVTEPVAPRPAEPAPPADVAGITPETRSAPSAAVAARDTAGAGEIRREAWLLQQPAGVYTLQLMSSDKEPSILKFIRERRLGADAAYFRTRRNGADWYAVVYSTYPSRAAAVAAAGRLPETLTDIKPWVRGMDAIHADINAAGAD